MQSTVVDQDLLLDSGASTQKDLDDELRQQDTLKAPRCLTSAITSNIQGVMANFTPLYPIPRESTYSVNSNP